VFVRSTDVDSRAAQLYESTQAPARAFVKHVRSRRRSM